MKRWSILLLCVAVLPAAAEENAKKADKIEADPAATKLLADARAARAEWDKFPGFSANLEVNIDGKVTRGSVTVGSKGKVEVKLDDEPAADWAKRELGSVVGHRLPGTATLDTPCAFADDVKDHPLGRAIRVLNDEFHSSYRVRDRQIIEVNRHMESSRFTITVMENRLNEEKKFLPACYVVNTWDGKTNALKSSQTFHQTWQRVGAFDLPLTVTVVTAAAGKQEARSLKLTDRKLTP
jgi:hypothetical protein